MVFSVAIAGLAWVCEFLVLGFFNSYAYKTGIFDNPWAQNLFGHLLLNTTLYPSIALITATAERRKYVFSFLVIFVTLIEFLFLRLGIYELHWWRTYMTTITVAVMLLIAMKWFDKIKDGCRGWTRAVTFYFVALPIVHLPAPVLLLLGKQHYHLRLIDEVYPDFYLESIIFIFLYHLLESLELVLCCRAQKWYLRLVPFIVSVAAQWTFAKLNLLVMDDRWHLVYTLMIYEAFIAGFVLIEKYTLKPQENRAV